MAEPLRSLPFTYDDYLLLPEDSPRCELLEGELLMTPAPTATHQTLLGRLFATIFNFLSTSPIGTVLFAPTDVVLSETTVVQPDLLFVAREHQDRIAEDGVHGPSRFGDRDPLYELPASRRGDQAAAVRAVRHPRVLDRRSVPRGRARLSHRRWALPEGRGDFGCSRRSFDLGASARAYDRACWAVRARLIRCSCGLGVLECGDMSPPSNLGSAHPLNRS